MKKKSEILKLFSTFFNIGLFTFGGGYAMIPLFTLTISLGTSTGSLFEVSLLPQAESVPSIRHKADIKAIILITCFILSPPKSAVIDS